MLHFGVWGPLDLTAHVSYLILKKPDPNASLCLRMTNLSHSLTSYKSRGFPAKIVRERLHCRSEATKKISRENTDEKTRDQAVGFLLLGSFLIRELSASLESSSCGR